MRRFFPAALLAGAAFLAGPLRAQAVDYAALQATMGEPVTASATGMPQRASETPASMVIITREEIAHSPAHDVPGLLKAYAGIDVNRWTAGQSDIAVRGGVQTYNARLLVLVNGRQVYLDHYGMTDWGLLGVQLEEIQQIELVRGPASALFGFNAASGVINIITVDALTAATLAGSAEIGTHGYDRLSLAGSLPIGSAIGLHLSGGHQRADERAIPATLLDPTHDNNVQRDELAATIEAALAPKTRLTIDGGYSRNRLLEFLPTQIPTEQRYEARTIGVRIDQDTDWGSLTGHAYANWLNALYGVGDSNETGADLGSMRTRTLVSNLSALVRLAPDAMLRLGGEYRNNELTSTIFYAPQIHYDLWSGSATIDLHPNPRVAVTLAGRVDHVALGESGAPVQPVADPSTRFDQAFTRASFNAAILTQIGKDGQLRINGGRGLQSPSLIDFGVRLPLGTADGIPFVLAGDAGDRPVPTWSGEIGYSQPIGKMLTLDGSLFYTRTASVIGTPSSTPSIDFVPGPSPLIVTRLRNGGRFDTYGVELSASGRLMPRMSWQANYSWTQTDQALDTTHYTLNPRDATARHKANIVLTYDPGRWFATGAARYTSATRQYAASPLILLETVGIPAAFALDAKLGYRLQHHLTLFAAGENLTKADGATGSPIPADRRLRMGMSFAL